MLSLKINIKLLKYTSFQNHEKQKLFESEKLVEFVI